MWKYLSKIFLSGIVFIVPLFITFSVLHWIFMGLESFSKQSILLVLPKDYYYPGMGAATVIILIVVVGILSRTWLTRYILDFIEFIFTKIPLVSSIYKPLKDMAKVMNGDMSDKLGQPVIIKLPNTDVETLGFITRKDLSDLPEGFTEDKDKVAVYVQWSYQIGGYCFLVPKDSIRTVDLSPEEGLRWSLSAGISMDAKSETT